MEKGCSERKKGISGKRKKALIRHLKTLNARAGGPFDKYDRKSDPNGPRQDLIRYAQLAIASYNKTQSQCYTVVDIIRSEKHCVRGYILLMEFTTKPHNQDDDDDAIIFRASLLDKCNGIDDVLVCFIGPITEKAAASKPLKDTPRGP